MGQTAFTGPVVSGDQGPGTPTPNQGFAILMQQIVLNESATVGATATTFWLPLDSIINTIDVDVLTAFTGTTAVLNIGTVATPALYAGPITLAATGRIAIVFTAAQLAAINGLIAATGLPTVLPTPAAVQLQVVTTGVPTTAGVAAINFKYVQITSSYS